MAKLYEIMQEIENFDFDIDEETGEILNVNDLDALNLEKDIKVENIALWIKNLKSDAEAYKNEKKAFEFRQRQAENKAESLKRYLARMLDGEKFKTDKVVISWRKSEAVELKEGSKIFDIDEEYLTYSDPRLDKVKIKDAIKNGADIKGVELISKNNISIK